MVWLYRLAREHLDEPATRAALLLLAAYPFAVFFSAAYAESLMLLAAVAAFYHFKHEKWVAAAARGLLAGLTRPNGFLLAGPLGVIGLQQALARRASAETRDQLIRHALIAAGIAAMPLVGTLMYSAFVYSLTGDPVAWREAHTALGPQLYRVPDAAHTARIDHRARGGRVHVGATDRDAQCDRRYPCLRVDLAHHPPAGSGVWSVHDSERGPAPALRRLPVDGAVSPACCSRCSCIWRWCWPTASVSH